MARLRSGKTHEALKSKIITVLIWVVIIMTAIVTIWSQSNLLTVSELKYKSQNLPKSLNGYKILNISDIDNTPLTLVAKVRETDPDAVVLSGGYCDMYGNYNNSYNAIQEIAQEYPTYYVYSTEDMLVGDDILSGTGAVNITNTCIELKNNKDYETYMINAYGDKFYNKVKGEIDRYKEFGEYSIAKLEETKDASIAIFGLTEYTDSDGKVDTTNTYNDVIAQTGSTTAGIKICVTHNADLVDQIVTCPLNAVLTGGTHGSENDYGLGKGKYSVNGKNVYVSGGVGSLDTLRIFNFPEFEVITFTDGTVVRPNPLEQVLNEVNNDDPVLNSDAGFKKWERQLNSNEDDSEE